MKTLKETLFDILLVLLFILPGAAHCISICLHWALGLIITTGILLALEILFFILVLFLALFCDNDKEESELDLWER